MARKPTAIIFDAAGALRKTAELHTAIVHVPESVGDGFEADGLLGQDVADINPGLCQRMPPLRLTFRSSKWPGYSRGSTGPRYGRGEA